MEKVLVTFPGRAGDLCWTLPTVRAISQSLGHPVDLQIAGEFESMLDLLRLQPYLGHVCANPHWGVGDPWEQGVPMPVGTPAGTYDRVIHLGYRRWPELPLPVEVYDQCRSREINLPLPPLDLETPWITVLEPFDMGRLVCGWTDCYFELKVGLHALMEHRDGWAPAILAAPGSRWLTEPTHVTSVHELPWVLTAEAIADAQVFLGDCSALHVLACALGKHCILVEPMEARWNPIFYPYGMDGRVTVVKGLDGKPTFDARHVADALREALR